MKLNKILSVKNTDHDFKKKLQKKYMEAAGKCREAKRIYKKQKNI